MKWPEPAQIIAFSRNVGAGIAGAAAILIALGFTQADITALINFVTQMGTALSALILALTAISPVVTGIYAAIKASRASRIKAMDADPQIAKVETVPGTEAAATAAAIPGTKVT